MAALTLEFDTLVVACYFALAWEVDDKRSASFHSNARRSRFEDRLLSPQVERVEATTDGSCVRVN